jgi:hypothetical protein
MDAWHGSAGLAWCLVWFPGVKHEFFFFFVKMGKKILCGSCRENTHLQHIHFSWS